MKTILLVDDSSLVINMLTKALNDSFKNIKILTAKSVKEAANYILNEDITIHIGVIDLNLPDGYDGEVVDLTINKDIPTIVLTGLLSQNIKNIILEKRVIDFILKDSPKVLKQTLTSIDRVLKNYDTNILVVDDSSTQLIIATKMLNKIKLNVTTAKNGKDAYDILESSDKKFSLVLTDYHMPEMDGIELTLKIREKYDKDELGIIVLSGNKDIDVHAQCIKMGANDFINKPYSEIEVSTRVNSNLEILELFQKTRDMANKDFLTGAYNRRYFFETGQATFRKAKRAKKDLVVAMFDIDKFKNINDTYGHNIGDIAIKEIAKILNKNLRDSDLMARFGGEEFCVLLENISLENTKILFEKIRLAFENNILHALAHTIKYTVSIGVCYGIEDNLEMMIKKADEGLYYCKNNGRNQVAINK